MKRIVYFSLLFFCFVNTHQGQDVENIFNKTWISISVQDCSSDATQYSDINTLMKIRFYDKRTLGILGSRKKANEFSVLELNNYTTSSYWIVDNKIKLEYVEYLISDISNDTLRLVFRNGSNCLNYTFLEENTYKRRIYLETIPYYKGKFINDYFIIDDGDTIRSANQYFHPLLISSNRIHRDQRKSLKKFSKQFGKDPMLLPVVISVGSNGVISRIDFGNESPAPEFEELLKDVVLKTAVKWQPVEIDGLTYHSADAWYLLVDLGYGDIVIRSQWSFD